MKKGAKPIIVDFKGQNFELSFHLYEHANHLALALNGAGGGRHEHWAAVVYAPEANLGPKQVLVHDVLETRGMLNALQEAGVVRATGKYRPWCGVSLPVAELLVEPPAHLQARLERQTSVLDHAFEVPGKKQQVSRGRESELER